MKIRRLLVPIDLSAASARVVDAARQLASATRAHVTVLHVIQAVHGLDDPAVARFYRRLEKVAGDRIGRACRTLGRGGVRVDGLIVIGDPVREILRAGRRVDLIVMGSHRVRRRAGLGLGTTSHAVALLNPGPVLLVR
jgi:universal stress protein A